MSLEKHAPAAKMGEQWKLTKGSHKLPNARIKYQGG